ncbi:unnamed protein product [Nesidiocoris tenuis]|uniref:Uncharacterized protein n=1 Tax=Nesidiocoris tenuis TaxID=355587 RepID=A0A6H5G4X1_9HEMI|nr:unnamed protein product [Nesidiocoris tenuis]
MELQLSVAVGPTWRNFVKRGQKSASTALTDGDQPFGLSETHLVIPVFGPCVILPSVHLLNQITSGSRRLRGHLWIRRRNDHGRLPRVSLSRSTKCSKVTMERNLRRTGYTGLVGQ